MTTAPPPTPKPRCRWLQFSLRTLLVVMLLISVPLAWLGRKMREAREQQTAAEAIRALRGHVEYEREPFDGEILDDASPSCEFGLPEYKRWGPAWLDRWLGDDFFVRIIEVWGVESDEGLEHAARLPHLNRLAVGPWCYPLVTVSWAITDAGLEHLRASSQLETLYLPDTKVTDAGLVYLKALPRLQSLCLRNTQITDTGLHHLKGLRQLQTLDLQNTQVTDAGIDGLRKALPHLTVYR